MRTIILLTKDLDEFERWKESEHTIRLTAASPDKRFIFIYLFPGGKVEDCVYQHKSEAFERVGLLYHYFSNKLISFYDAIGISSPVFCARCGTHEEADRFFYDKIIDTLHDNANLLAVFDESWAHFCKGNECIKIAFLSKIIDGEVFDALPPDISTPELQALFEPFRNTHFDTENESHLAQLEMLRDAMLKPTLPN